ncbi:MAG: hypothetical protein IKO52_12300 [Clostridia bacterium]|nr:hypothetical protein [Clostridia bacterium]
MQMQVRERHGGFLLFRPDFDCFIIAQIFGNVNEESSLKSRRAGRRFPRFSFRRCSLALKLWFFLQALFVPKLFFLFFLAIVAEI